MNKYKALGLGLLFLLLAIIVWATGGDIVGWWLFLPAVCWFLPVGGYKFYRDWAIIAQANADRLAVAEQPPVLSAPPNPEDYLSLGHCLNVAKTFLIREIDRYAGLYILGVQGVGKSAQLVNLILRDALAGHAVIVIDPHGDLITDCIKRLPEHLLHKVYRLDMADEHHPPGVNVFGGNDVSTSLKLTEVVERVMHIFESVWPDVLKQVYLPRYLRNFLLNESVRTRLLKNVTDPTVIDFCQTQYEELNYADRMKRVQPLLSRLELAIVAEVIILLSFAMSGMDVSLGGVMASVPLLKILWAGMFALGIDTAFALSWVRVRQSVLHRNWLAFSWNMLLAVGMSIIVFQPIAIQLLQQSLGIDFTQAVSNLGINIVFLTYARAAVAVALGAILAMTNVESEMGEQRVLTGPQRKIVLFERLLNRVAPIVGGETPPAQIEVSEEIKPETPAQIPTNEDVSKQSTMLLPTVSAPVPAPDAQPEVRTDTTPQERIETVRELDLAGLSTAERVAKVAALFPDVSDRELGKLSGVSAATAKKYRQRFMSGQPATDMKDN